MAETIAEEEDDKVGILDDEDDEYAHGGVNFGAETVLLEKVVQKLAVMSEITMKKSPIDAETMEQLGEGLRCSLELLAVRQARPGNVEKMTSN